MNNADDDDDNYYGGGCFTGESLIRLRDRSFKMVKDLKKGDQVATPSGFASIRCIVKMLSKEGVKKLCTIEGGLRITPGHPILQNG